MYRSWSVDSSFQTLVLQEVVSKGILLSDDGGAGDADDVRVYRDSESLVDWRQLKWAALSILSFQTNRCESSLHFQRNESLHLLLLSIHVDNQSECENVAFSWRTNHRLILEWIYTIWRAIEDERDVKKEETAGELNSWLELEFDCFVREKRGSGSVGRGNKK